MNFVIPMAGLGSRFKDSGFEMPKPLIEVHGKTLLQWSVDSLPLGLSKKIIFILQAEIESKFKIIDKIKHWYEEYNLEFLLLNSLTRGQSETVFLAKDLFDADQPLLIFNIDTYFECDDLSTILASGAEGVLGCFKSNKPNYSYAKIGSNGSVVEVREKKVISEFALNGLYFFKYSNDFTELAEYQIVNDIREKNEFYVAPLYNELIRRGKTVLLSYSKKNYILGTPKELSFFKKNYE